ncbi:MAG: hypothetical protein OYH76_01710 [Defluviicoccus sp.]|nr:hypothetical protein [Defluviicoccus sp.]MDE0274581.1 hypothetical protein [Defluviicoccus sp.]
MNTTLLRGSDHVLSEITVAEDSPRAIAIERLHKHAYHCRIGEDRFVFRTPRSDPKQPPRGPGLALRRTLQADDPTLVELQDLPGRPGVIQSVEFQQPLAIHIERMSQTRYFCRIGDHEFAIVATGRRSAGVELVRA